MKIPSNFKTNIANTFYDKVITLYTTVETVDSEGWASLKETVTSNTFDGNVRFDNLAELQKDYGIEEVIDIVITTEQDVTNGTIIGYDSVTYKVIKAIPFDTHNLLVGKKWSSKSSTLTSA